jgi:hypothetical protein
MPYLPAEYDWITEPAMVDQEGGIMAMTSARCPRCTESCKLSYWKGTGFLCPSCDVFYDEPAWHDAENDYRGMLEDEEWTGWGPVVRRPAT